MYSKYNFSVPHGGREVLRLETNGDTWFLFVRPSKGAHFKKLWLARSGNKGKKNRFHIAFDACLDRLSKSRDCELLRLHHPYVAEQVENFFLKTENRGVV